MVEKWILAAVIGIALFLTGFAKGCAYDKRQYAEAETRFAVRTEVITKVEKVEVPKFIKQIEWLKETETKLVEAANAEPINVPGCNLSPERVRRIREAATGLPQ